MPPINIILLTYARTDYALRTIQGVIKNLRYSGEIRWIIADDGSSQEHFNAVLEALKEQIVYAYFSAERAGYGANANRAWDLATQESPLTLWLEDDWVLERELDLTNYANVLLKYDHVGMIRLGLLPIDLDLFSIGLDGTMYLRVNPTTDYVFSGNPHLKHDRFKVAYGYYPTGKNPGETEISYDWQIRGATGPEIIWPVELGPMGIWGHIGAEQSYV